MLNACPVTLLRYTEVYEQSYIACQIAECRVLDSGRRINGEESFTIVLGDVAPDSDLLLITRLHPVNSGTFDVYVNNQFVATRWIPSLPGRWLEIPTLIPHDIVADPLYIRIVPDIPGGHYMPYRHWVYEGEYKPEIDDGDSLATYQDGAIQLIAYDHNYRPGADQMTVTLTWQTDGNAEGDYLVFVHLYDDLDQPPVAQRDMRPGQGTLLPGNWLPGVLRDEIVVDLSDVPSGQHQLVLGFYDLLTHERLIPIPQNDLVEMDGRLLLERIENR
jgi:hypothetical protein